MSRNTEHYHNKGEQDVRKETRIAPHMASLPLQPRPLHRCMALLQMQGPRTKHIARDGRTLRIKKVAK